MDINCENVLSRLEEGRKESESELLKKLSWEDDSFDVHCGLYIPGVMWDYQSLKPPDCSSLVAQ